MDREAEEGLADNTGHVALSELFLVPAHDRPPSLSPLLPSPGSPGVTHVSAICQVCGRSPVTSWSRPQFHHRDVGTVLFTPQCCWEGSLKSRLQGACYLVFCAHRIMSPKTRS